jgi:hypothetical protein
LWDGLGTWFDPYDLERLYCGDPACRYVVEKVNDLPLSEYLATPEGG